MNFKKPKIAHKSLNNWVRAVLTPFLDFHFFKIFDQKIHFLGKKIQKFPKKTVILCWIWWSIVKKKTAISLIGLNFLKFYAAMHLNLFIKWAFFFIKRECYLWCRWRPEHQQRFYEGLQVETNLWYSLYTVYSHR